MSRETQRIEVAVTSIGAILLAAVIAVGDLSLRQVASVLGVICFGGLIYRMIPYWGRMTRLEQVLSGILCLVIIISAAGSLVLDQARAPGNPMLWPVLISRVTIIVVIVLWPWWIESTAPRTRKVRARR